MGVLFEDVHSDPLLIFFVQLALTLALTRILSKLFSYMNQPAVIGEIVAGIIMGPSVLGHIPGFTQAVWPTAVPQAGGHAPYDSTITFTVIADVGVVLFMFLLGCELDHHRLNSEWRIALPIALSAILVPFALGVANAMWLEDINNENQPPDFVPPRHRSFMLFTGTAMSFTAFPVLASLLKSMDLLATPIGLQALSCAAVDDVTAWCVLAVASAFAQSESPLQGLYTTIGAMCYIAIMVLILRPILAKVHHSVSTKDATNSPYYETVIFLLLIASAFTTEALGIHAFFGSFMMGLCVPKEGGFAEGLAGRMELVVTEVLLPLFFASSGIKTNIGTINTWRYWGVVLFLIALASVGKFAPACLTSKLLLKHRSWRFCSALGLMMNTRGLVEMIALNIGLTMGILSVRMFSMFVLMAIFTTWITCPSLALMFRNKGHELRGETQGLPVSTAATAVGGPGRTQSTCGHQDAIGSGSQPQQSDGEVQIPAAAAADAGAAGVGGQQKPSSPELLSPRVRRSSGSITLLYSRKQD